MMQNFSTAILCFSYLNAAAALLPSISLHGDSGQREDVEDKLVWFFRFVVSMSVESFTGTNTSRSLRLGLKELCENKGEWSMLLCMYHSTHPTILFYH